MFNIPESQLPECLKDENKINVLFTPVRSFSVNPKDWENKISSWKTVIKAYCDANDVYTFTLSSLNKVFIRNGRPPQCLPDVLLEMEKTGDVERLDIFLKNNPHSWGAWATNVLVKKPFVWTFNKFKNTLFSTVPDEQPLVHLQIVQKKCDTLLKSVPDNYKNKLLSLNDLLKLLNKTPSDTENVKLLLHYLSNQKIVDISTNNNNQSLSDSILIKIGDGHNCSITELDLSIYTLEQSEKHILKSIEGLEDSIEECIKEAKTHLSKNHKQTAKSSLRKKHDLEKLLEKKTHALRNIQTLLQQINETDSNKRVWESYKNVLSTFNSTYKNSGLSEDAIDDTMIQLGEVIDKSDDIQSALSKPAQHEFDESDLELELLELLKEDSADDKPPDGGGLDDSKLEDAFKGLDLNLPEVPGGSPDVQKEKLGSLY
ncbi:unnamed protein product [Phyllotreta striolata]|uniref:Charged multivesicular body protein 7 n=1 Tax=Phyllotreta striolata TaxID=444603 RepID=A0A9N9XNQ3_PHYSR|nr:unnamed protein product [Phyllotreta striolata]